MPALSVARVLAQERREGNLEVRRNLVMDRIFMDRIGANRKRVAKKKADRDLGTAGSRRPLRRVAGPRLAHARPRVGWKNPLEESAGKILDLASTHPVPLLPFGI
jgi:hypothetical protein